MRLSVIARARAASLASLRDVDGGYAPSFADGAPHTRNRFGDLRCKWCAAHHAPLGVRRIFCLNF